MSEHITAPPGASIPVITRKCELTKTTKITGRSPAARNLGIPGGGTVVVEWGLWYSTGNRYPLIGIGAGVNNNRGNMQSFGYRDPEFLRRYGNAAIAALLPFHGAFTGEGTPTHYTANALYRWEGATGLRKPSRYAPETPAQCREYFDSTIAFGTVSTDDPADHPCDWLRGVPTDPPDPRGVTLLDGPQPVTDAAIERARVRLREWLAARLPEWRATRDAALTAAGIDPTWHPQPEVLTLP